MNKITYCTLFDESYAIQGIQLINSLIKHTGSEFHIIVLAMSNSVEPILKRTCSDSYYTVIHLRDFELSHPFLLNVKQNRTIAEYCWTLTPFLIKHCLLEYKLNECIYLDSDIYFFKSANDVWNSRRGDSSIFITKHNFFPKHDTSFYTGQYCVQYMGFKNDKHGIKALEWWCDACFDWCFARMEENKFGDQKYLDDWLIRFEGVYVSNDIGHGVAPWNLERYDLMISSQCIKIIDKVTGDKSTLAFFHFHGLRFFNKWVILTESKYFISRNAIELIYLQYVYDAIEISKKFNLFLKDLPYIAYRLKNLYNNIYALLVNIKYFKKYNSKNLLKLGFEYDKI